MSFCSAKSRRDRRTSRDSPACGSQGRSQIANFAANSGGNISVIMAVVGLALIVTLGAAVDVARWMSARQDTYQAVDAALLAGGRALQLGKTDAEAIAVATTYYHDNSRRVLGGDGISFRVVDDGLGITAQGSAAIAPIFLSIIGLESLPILDFSGTEHATARLAAGRNARSNLEIALMLDVSSAMSGQNLQDMKEAANQLIDLLVWDDQSRYSSQVAIAPFSSDIRLSDDLLMAVADPSMSNAIRGEDFACFVGSELRSCHDVFYRRDCVVERIGEDRYTDAAPGPGRYLLPLFTRRFSNCATPIASAIMPPSSNKALLNSKINGLQTGGGRAGHLGTAWAWYLLSPDWADLFADSSKPQHYMRPDLKKIAILISGGAYDIAYSEKGIVAGTLGAPLPVVAANGPSSEQAVILCAGMKARGIEVFTIGFHIGGNMPAIETLDNCASGSSYAYLAQNGAQLRDAMQDITIKIAKIYLSH